MELFGILFIVLIAWLFLKLLAVFFNVTVFAIALPFKILALFLGLFLGVVLLIPLGLFAGLMGLLIAPFAILLPLLPIVLIALGVVLLIRNS